MESLWKDLTLITRLTVNELKEQFPMPTNVTNALESVYNVVTRTLDMDPSPKSKPWLPFFQLIEAVVTWVESVGEEFNQIDLFVLEFVDALMP